MIYINIATNKYMDICVNNNLSYKYGDNEYLNKLLCRDVLPLYNTLQDFRFFNKNKNIKILNNMNNMLNFYNNKKKQKKINELVKNIYLREIINNFKNNFK